jgi:hypothetical protein
MLSLSATGINLTIIVDADQVTPAIRRLHAAFFADAPLAQGAREGRDRPEGQVLQ